MAPLPYSFFLFPLPSFLLLLTWTRLAEGARRGTAEAAVAGAMGRAAVASAGREAKRDAIAMKSKGAVCFFFFWWRVRESEKEASASFFSLSPLFIFFFTPDHLSSCKKGKKRSEQFLQWRR